MLILAGKKNINGWDLLKTARIRTNEGMIWVVTTWAPLMNAVLFLHLTQRNQSLVPAVLPPPAQHPKLLHSLQ
jgi:hypothetical protein